MKKKKSHIQLLREDLCWQKRITSLATSSAVIACILINIAMGFSMATSNWDLSFYTLCYEMGCVAPHS